MTQHVDSQRSMVELSADIQDSPFSNPDIYPSKLAQRTWNKWDIGALWVGMAICIPTYMLAAGLLNQGMNWWQAVVTILVGNLIVLIPMMLNAHPGTKYGIPFPVLSRASFGIHGAHIPSLLRALVACGWFGIQTWIGGKAIYICLCYIPGFADLPALPTGINLGEFISFMIFWAINVYIIVKGIEEIRWLEKWAAPVLTVIGIMLFGWAVYSGGGIKPVLESSYQFMAPPVTVSHQQGQVELEFYALKKEGKAKCETVVIALQNEVNQDHVLQGKHYPYQDSLQLDLTDLGGQNGQATTVYVQFLGKNAQSSVVSAPLEPGAPPASVPSSNFWALLTAMVGFWATLSLNIPDFTRYAHSQKEQMTGQIIGLPPTMALYSFIGLFATSACLIAFDDILIAKDAPWDPVDLLGRMESPLVIVFAMFALAIATLSTNLAANVVAPANGFSNLWPTKISFRLGGIITGILGIVILPWQLIASTDGYIFTWLVGYSALLGPVAGIVIGDYYLVRKTQLDLYDLYQIKGRYGYLKGINPVAVVALVLGVLPNIPGFLYQAGFMKEVHPQLQNIYQYAWFVGFIIAIIVYPIGMKMYQKKD